MKKVLVPILFRYLVKPWLKYIIGVKYQNTDVINQHQQFIIIANHNSHFDTIAILASLDPKNLLNTYPAAAADYFGKTKLLRFISKNIMNTLLIYRKKEEGEPSAINQLDAHIKEGKSLLLFPEGTRGEAGEMSDFKKGIAVLLKKNPGLPFIPVYLLGFGRVLPKDEYMVLPMNCRVRYGEPVIPNKNQSVEDILNLTKETILALRKNDDREHNKFAFN